MSKKQWRFKPNEIRRLFHVVKTLGKTPIGVEVSADGAIKVLIGGPERVERLAPPEQQQPVNEWDTL
jgi:hypothetical protein